jgi:SAM-dependent MidA family methyltransferase
MNEWLYGQNGYYSKFREIGKAGDFYTAVSSSQFFGGSIANEIIKLVENGEFSEKVLICEIGAHKGYLLDDIITFIYTLRPHLLKTLSFAVVERFEEIQNKQREFWKDSFGDEVQIEIFSSLSEINSNETIFIANEIFDAFPTELFYNGKIATVENGKIEFNLEDEKVSEIAKNRGKDRGEIPLNYGDFAKELKNASKKFQFITFDYGDDFPRLDFSIRVYQKHKVFPLFEENLPIEELFGKTDITFDVDFGLLESEFEKEGLKKIEYKTQMRALVDFGLLELLELLKEKTDTKTYTSELNRVKILIDPSFMGERFKMIRFAKN